MAAVEHEGRRWLRRMLFTTSAIAATALLLPAAAAAQEAPATAPQTATPPEAETGDILVTGTRVIRDGYRAPTPTSVIGAADIARKAPSNLADFVNELPALSGSTNPRSHSAAVSGGTFGVNALSLRALGANRTLILLDGRRVAASTLGGLVDINTIPQALVKRVDVVTGGASADWGSDAVAGVVNFVLDTEFTGVKGLVQGGVTTYGDDRNYNLQLAAGTKFAGGRGHFMLSGEVAHNDGIRGIGKRTWYNGAKIINNPAYTATNGQPQLLALPNVGFTTATPGGIITTGPLAGTYFGPGGTPARQIRGSIVSGNFFQGGDWRYSDFALSGDLDPEIDRQSVFGRLSYDITDKIEVYAEGSYSRATSEVATLNQFNFGSYTIQPDNAFIPASIAPQVSAPFNLGTFHTDLGPIIATTRRSSARGVIGLRGQFDALGGPWKWDVSAVRTVNNVFTGARISVNARLAQAIDSVRNAQGVIVCRSTLTNPTNGCVPYNVFGEGVNAQPAIDYVYGNATLDQRLVQEVYGGTLRGNPFSTWAGPVSVALGVEHRRESVTGFADALDEASQATSLANGTARVPPYFAGNYLPSKGSYQVTEGFLEAVVPIAKDMSFAKTLDLNLAVRATDYSTSGYVTTWKAGLTYEPVDGITFRATRSRDIRAPNLAELFQAAGAATASVTDPFRANALTPIFQVTRGDPNLKPEKADTLGLGVVVQPAFLPGFAASVDYYRIGISNSISTVNAPTVLNQCFLGNTQFCSQLTRNGAGVLTQIDVLPVNVARQVARGLDFEASYRTRIAGGDLSLRAMATRFLEFTSEDGITPRTDFVGTNSTAGSLRTSLPKWRYTASVGYDHDPISMVFTARGFSAGEINTTYVECTSACPASTAANMTINDNRMPGAIYFDANFTYKVATGVQAFFAVDNIANRDPHQMPYGPTIGANPISVNPVLYDVVGRSFRVGIRFKL